MDQSVTQEVDGLIDGKKKKKKNQNNKWKITKQHERPRKLQKRLVDLLQGRMESTTVIKLGTRESPSGIKYTVLVKWIQERLIKAAMDVYKNY